ncbi:hypothetical protein [Faecalibaculum rodentium]|uniref:hypothetical protein n=1 Tax=Faecalibaculum rodentium TaxID=1702221 RepID=UPI00272A53F7|nr:hypothetical protein [Faecalibaculum rodentium]
MTFEIIEIREGKLGYKIALLQRPEGAPERYVVAKDYNPEKRIWHMGGYILQLCTMPSAVLSDKRL